MSAPDPSIAYQSEFVCEQLARRVVRSYRFESAKATMEKLRRAYLGPVIEQIANGGKIQQGKMRVLARALEKRLESDPALVSMDIHTSKPSQLSSNETQRMAFIVASASENTEDWVQFLSNEIVLTRISCDITSIPVDFNIHRHALARFMNRELRPAEEIMPAMKAAIYFGYMIAYVGIAVNCPHVAVPVGDGMLFGRTEEIVNARSPKKTIHTKISRRFVSDHEPIHLTHVAEYRPLVKAMTYVDGNSLTPSRQRVHDIMVEFFERHRLGITLLFESDHYNHVLLPTGQTVDDVEKHIDTAMSEMRSILTGPDYGLYVDTVGING